MKEVLVGVFAGCITLSAGAIDGATFNPVLRQQVLPWFEASRTTGELRAADGIVLRWYAIEAARDRAALVVLPGWTEAAESFVEVLYDLRDLGISCYVLDHRGQGLSGGEIQPRDKWHLEHWESLVTDLELFMEKVVRARPHGKVILYGNSMGGALATVYMARHPQAVQGAVLVAPMLGIKTDPVPLPITIAALRILALLGKGTSYAPGHGPYKRYPFEGNPWSITSRPRYEFLDWLNESRAEYQLGGATARGGLELVGLSRAASAAAPRVEVPVLLVQAGLDEMVKNAAQDRAAHAMRNCRLFVVPGTHHLVMHQTDELRGQAVAAIRGFLEEQLR